MHFLRVCLFAAIALRPAWGEEDATCVARDDGACSKHVTDEAALMQVKAAVHLQSGVDKGVKAASTAPSAASFISHGKWVQAEVQLKRKVKGLKTQQPMPPMPPMPNGTMPDCESAQFVECFRLCSPCIDGEENADGGSCDVCEACNEFIPCLFMIPGLFGPYGPPMAAK